MLNHLLNGLSAVGNVLDLPGSSVRDVLAWKNPFDQYLDPLGDSQRTSGRDLLRSYGMAGQHDTWGNFAGGLASEIATDPTNLISGKAILNAMRGRRAAASANTGIRASNAKSLLQRASGYMPEEIASQTAIKTENGLPKRMYHGTDSAFDKFDLKHDTGSNLYGKGIYTTDSPHLGSQYAMSGIENNLVPRDEAKLAEAYRSHINKYRPDEITDPIFGRELHNDSTAVINAMSELQDTSFRHPHLAEDLMPHMTSSSKNNVRMHYLDVRNPFDAEAIYPVTSLPSIKGKQSLKNHLQAKADFARETARDMINNIRVHRKAENGMKPPQHWTDNVMENFRNRHAPNEISGDEFLGYIHDATGDINSIPVAVNKMGHDGISHLGGKRIGTDAHNVVIATSPSQVYKPYIAPVLKPEVPIPSARNGLKIGIAGYNVLARSRNKQK